MLVTLFGVALNPVMNAVMPLLMVIAFTNSMHLAFDLRAQVGRGEAVPDAIRAALERVVLFDADPFRRLRLGDDTVYRWTVLTTDHRVTTGRRVMGTVAIPNALWLAESEADTWAP